MLGNPLTTRDALNQLEPGTWIEVTHTVKVGLKSWTTTVQGEVMRVERRRQGLHFRRNLDDKAFSDLIVLRHADGTLTTLTMDEYTDIRRL
jgi:hypothetical protein